MLSIVVTTYGAHAQEYLDLCLRSLCRVDFPLDQLDIVVASSGEYRPRIYGGLKCRHYHSDERKHFSGAVNFGVSQTNPKSDLLMIAGDDVVFTRDSLKNMVLCLHNNRIVLNPLSNCDNFAKYVIPMFIPKGNEVLPMASRFYRYNDLKDHHEGLMNAQSIFPAGSGMFRVDYNAVYATLMHRKTWEQVGQMDERFKTGQDDLDWCMRAKALGIPCFVTLDAIVWHFGGVTADVVHNEKTRLENIKAYEEKHGAPIIT